MATPAANKTVAKKAAPKKKAAATKRAPARQPRRTREQGMDLLISAAFTLIRKKNPDDISIREIASPFHCRMVWQQSTASLSCSFPQLGKHS